MKTGIILYVAGDMPQGSPSRVEDDVKRLNIRADRLEIITKESGHFDVSDAWWALTIRGMHQITCYLAYYNPAGGLTLADRSLTLCG